MEDRKQILRDWMDETRADYEQEVKALRLEILNAENEAIQKQEEADRLRMELRRKQIIFAHLATQTQKYDRERWKGKLIENWKSEDITE